MAATTPRKRSRRGDDDDGTTFPKAKPARPTKKQRKQALDAYHSDSDAHEFPAVNLLDSDSDDIHNARADDGGASASDFSDDDDDAAAPAQARDKSPTTKTSSNSKNAAKARAAPPSALAHGAPPSASSASSSNDNDNDEFPDLSASDAASASDSAAGTGGTGANRAKLRAKRTDPAAFASSLAKILSTKLASARRADPVLARSAAAHEAGRKAADAALEGKARKQLRAARRAAMERGRVKDVLVATAGGGGALGDNVHPVTGEIMAAAREGGETAGTTLETERRLRKVAQRGVVQLFNAFRTAQAKAAEAERGVRKGGVIGVDRKKEKVTEMSKKGFLDLIAAGGGGLKKGPLEEA